MIFQTFDEKQDCFMVYKDSKFHKTLTPTCTETWSYATYLQDKEIEYASLYALEKTLEDLCPIGRKLDFADVQSKIKAVIKSCKEVGLDLNKMCIYEVMPRHLLTNWAQIKTEICENVFKNHEKPQNYEQLLKITKVIADIKHRSLNLDPSKITRITVQDKNTHKLVTENKPFIDYDMTKTVTGRLSTKKGSFPVMTLAKKYRNILTPTNSWLYELDFNACELRTALAILGCSQPEEDLHDWNLAHVFTRAKDRDNAKKRIFSWLYNPKSKDDKVSKIYDREKLKTLHYLNNKVITPFGRKIECDEDHAVNYLVQSTAADLVFEQMYKVWTFLRGKKSFIKFCNHDSIMIDLHIDDQFDVNNIKNLFSNTRFGNFRVNCLGGKNWANMRKLHIR
jgi:hypothetical protein